MRLAPCGIWLSLLCVKAACAAAADGVKSVYLMPMANGLDQFLANRLTGSDGFQVVTDAKKASAVFTDKLGEGFDLRLTELTAPPPPPKDDEKKTDEQKADEKKAEEKKAEEAMPVHRSTFGGGKGTVFLVEVASRRVLWSTFANPRDSSPKQMDRTAALIVNRLKKDPARQ